MVCFKSIDLPATLLLESMEKVGAELGQLLCRSNSRCLNYGPSPQKGTFECALLDATKILKSTSQPPPNPIGA